MDFKNYRLGIAIRLGLVVASLLALIMLVLYTELYMTYALLVSIILYQLFELFRYTDQTNQKLQQFLESIRYGDFSVSFYKDNKLGSSFSDLNKSFAAVIKAFQQARAEKEENLRYLDTVVQNIGIGLLVVAEDGRVQLMNRGLRRLLGIPYLNTLAGLQPNHPQLYESLQRIKGGETALLRADHGDMQLMLQATEFRQRGVPYKLISIQDIQPELEQKELEAWRNLARVLRHEIMNSITPITSLSTTIRELVQHELQQQHNPNENLSDIHDGLETIERRSLGLMHFVDAYRTYTSIPKPNMGNVAVEELLNRVATLMQDDLQQALVQLSTHCTPPHLILRADAELVEMMLINLVKNAKEALSEQVHRKVSIAAFLDNHRQVVIEVSDNGPGIIPEAIDKIFIPFFTTKKGGTGVGLSWSKQIMQSHRGQLTVHSIVGQHTTFSLKFPNDTSQQALEGSSAPENSNE